MVCVPAIYTVTIIIRCRAYKYTIYRVCLDGFPLPRNGNGGLLYFRKGCGGRGDGR